jgi:activator of 2-hydroxyglutaryl-CoA dehydratase
MAILNRTLSLMKRVSTTLDIVFAGGVAKNPCIKRLLGDELGGEVKVPEYPQMVGAFGAAIIAQESGELSRLAKS